MKNTHLAKLKADSAGFTLVELMIVIFIMGLLTGAVLLTLPDNDRILIEDAEKFAAKVAALRDNAILQSRPMAVQVTASGYSFVERRKGNWRAMSEKPFTSINWSDGVQFASEKEGAQLVSFESTGLPSEPAQIILTYQNKLQAVALDQTGNVALVNDSSSASR